MVPEGGGGKRPAGGVRARSVSFAAANSSGEVGCQARQACSAGAGVTAALLGSAALFPRCCRRRRRLPLLAFSFSLPLTVLSLSLPHRAGTVECLPSAESARTTTTLSQIQGSRARGPPLIGYPLSDWQARNDWLRTRGPPSGRSDWLLFNLGKVSWRLENCPTPPLTPPLVSLSLPPPPPYPQHLNSSSPANKSEFFSRHRAEKREVEGGGEVGGVGKKGEAKPRSNAVLISLACL